MQPPPARVKPVCEAFASVTPRPHLDSPAPLWLNPRMGSIAFDTLKLARRLAAAGVPMLQAEATAEALAETLGEGIVTREHLDARLAELRTELVKWMAGLLLGQTAVISALVKLL